MRFRILLLAVTLLALPGRASAAPIGTFDWVYDSLFGTGSSFIVTNESTLTFQSVFIDLFAPGATDSFQALSLGDIDGSGGFAQSFDDLSPLLVPDDVNRAILRLVFSDVVITTTLLASALQGDPADLLAISVVIDDGADPPPASVPEPSAALLVAIGLGGFIAFRGRSGLKLPTVRGAPRPTRV